MHSDFDLLAMLLLGLTGTGHCLGMCGPLVIAIPGQVGRWSAHLAYHAGRLITYTLIGAVLGAVSGSLPRLASGDPSDPLNWITRLQIVISLLAAVLLLTLGLHRLGILKEPQWLSSALPQKIPCVGSAISRNIRRGTLGSVFSLGLALGLLPCGLSYAAFAGTLASGNLFHGAQLAFCFGLGTLPGLLLLGTGAGIFWTRFRQYSEIISGLIMVAMALALAVRMWTSVL